MSNETKFLEMDTARVYDAMGESGHDFEVEMQPLLLPCGKEIWDKKATVRKDTGQYLGTVGSGYNLLQPIQFYEMAHQLIEATGGRINKTVTMSNGAVIGISFNLATREYVDGDPVELNFLMMTSFNMRYSILGRALSNRLFCLNQLPSSTSLFNIKHTRYLDHRLDTAMKMLGYYGKEMKGFDSKMNLLTQYRMPEARQIEWFTNLFPKPKAETRAVARLDNQTDKFAELLVTGLGTDHPNVKGTGYHALNALTEFCNHHRSTRVSDGKTEEEVRFEAITFGSADTLMQKGFTSLLQLAKTDPQDRYVR